MAERSQYNERFTFPDPSSTDSSSRSTRYRARKRAREYQEEQLEEPLEEHMEEPSEEQLEEDHSNVDASHQCRTLHSLTEYTEIDNPQVLEAELLGFESSADEDEQLDDEQLDDEQLDDDASAATNTDCPLYSGASLTVSSSNILIMQYKMRHNLTDQALADLLHLLRLHCPTPNHCVPSIYHFEKPFQRMKYPILFHYFCSSCLQGVSDSDSFCKNQLCRCELKAIGARSSFIEVPIEAQLQTLFQRKYMSLAGV